jgi:hypothetical protein
MPRLNPAQWATAPANKHSTDEKMTLQLLGTGHHTKLGTSCRHMQRLAGSAAAGATGQTGQTRGAYLHTWEAHCKAAR